MYAEQRTTEAGGSCTAHVPKLEELGEYEAGAGQGRRLNEAEKRPEVVH